MDVATEVPLFVPRDLRKEIIGKMNAQKKYVCKWLNNICVHTNDDCNNIMEVVLEVM
jgi:hypothetical protein